MYPILFNMGICFLTMKIADEITRYFHSKNTSSAQNTHDFSKKNTEKINISYTTMRDMPYDLSLPPNKLENLKKVYSYMQLYATYYMLGNINSAFTPMFAIQISSFLMTLVKKNIINPMFWHPLYFSSLLTNIFSFYTLTPIFIIKMNFACSLLSYWRMKLGYNKYIGWLIVFAFHYFSLIYLENPIDKYYLSHSQEGNKGKIYHWFSFLFKTGDNMVPLMTFIMKLGLLYHFFKYSPI